MTALPIELPTAEQRSLDWERLTERFAWLHALASCPQDPVHHAEGDVWIHTKMVCEALIELPAWQALPVDERTVVLAAGLFHDIAKPATTRCDEAGRVTAHGHSRRGELMARAELYRMGVDFATREAVAALVRVHQVPFFLIDERDARRRAIALSHRTRCDHLGSSPRPTCAAASATTPRSTSTTSSSIANSVATTGCSKRPGACATTSHATSSFVEARARPLVCRMGWRQPSSEVVLLSGLPASGKDTWVNDHARAMEVISLDDLRDALDAEPTGDQGAVIMAAKERARELLRQRVPFVWNGTNLTRQRRAELVGLFTDYGARVRIVYVESPWSDLRAQNKARAREGPLRGHRRHARPPGGARCLRGAPGRAPRTLTGVDHAHGRGRHPGGAP